jgi:hypothetical protein
MFVNILRKYIRHLILERYLLEKDSGDEQPDDLLLEPDASEEQAQDEVNAVANIAGVTAPLGQGPAFPANKNKKKKKLPKGWQKSK